MERSVRTADERMDGRHEMGHIPHVRRSAEVTGIHNLRFRRELFHVCHEQVIHLFAAVEGQHARQRLHNGLGAYGVAAGFQGRVHPFVGVVNGFHGSGTHIQFHAHIRGHVVHQVAAFGDDGVHPDDVLLAESFPQGVDTHETQAGRVQSIDAFVGGVGRVSGLANILHGLTYEPVAGTADGHRLLGHVGLGVHHHGHVDVVEVAFVNKLALAADIMQFPLLPQALPVGNFHIFFCRNGEEHGITCQFLHDTGFDDTGAGRQHDRSLEEMAAGVGRSGKGIRFGTVRGADGIQFRQYRHGRSGLTAFDPAFDTGEGQTGLRIQT